MRGIGGMVYLAASPTTAAVKILQARSWRIDISQDLVEATQGFGAIWKQYLLASTGWKGQVDGNFDSTQTTPFTAAQIPVTQGSVSTYSPVAFYLYPDGTNASRFYSGTIWPNLTVDARLTNTIRFTMMFVGHGALNAV